MAKRGGISDIHLGLTVNLPRNLAVIFLNRLKIDRIKVISLWPRFLAHRRHGPTNLLNTSCSINVVFVSFSAF